jgi:hypothetical protein
MSTAGLRFEVNITSLYRLLFIVILCAPFWFTVASSYARKLPPWTTRASRVIARVLTALLWGNIVYSLLVTWAELSVCCGLFPVPLLVASWPGVMAWWLLRLLIRFGGVWGRKRVYFAVSRR